MLSQQRRRARSEFGKILYFIVLNDYISNSFVYCQTVGSIKNKKMEAEAAEAEAQQKRDELALKTVNTNTKIAAVEKELLKMKAQQSTIKARLALHSNENNPPLSKKFATSSKQHPSTGFIVESKVCSVPEHGIYYHTDLKDAIAAGKPLSFANNYQLVLRGKQEGLL